MYLIFSYLSYVLLGFLTVLVTTYLIPILNIFKTKHPNKLNQTFIYIGFLISYTLIYFGLNLIKNVSNDFVFGFLLLTLFFTLIFHSVLLVLDITFIELLKGIQIKNFKHPWITSLFFGIKFSLLQVLCNPVFFLVLVINVFELNLGIVSINKFLFYVAGIIILTQIILNLSKEKFAYLLGRINYKQKIINILSSIITILISFIFILNYI